MKKVIINIVKFTIFLSLFIFLINLAGNILLPTGWRNHYQGQIFTTKGFYEMPDNQIDVLFMGSSTMQKGVSPMELYNNTGITSYNYSISSARIYMMYYFMIDVLKTQKPKVVFADPITLFYAEREMETEQRKSFDNMPFSKNKVNMIFDNVFNTTFEEKISYLFPLLRYHSRWKELTIQDLTKLNNSYHSITKGYLMSSKIIPCKKGNTYMIPTGKNVDMKDFVKEYFYKFLDLCRKNDIDVVFLGIPDVRAWNYESSEKLMEYVKENNVKFLDLNNSDRYIYDWNSDFEDGGYHMNIYGAMKTTKYVEEYITKNYKFTDKRNSLKYSKWNEDLKKYLQEKEKTINNLKKKKILL